jgi:hypothetical protein
MARTVKQDGDAARIVGLSEFRASLKAVDASLPKEIGRLNKKVGDLIVDQSQSTAAGVGRQAAKAAESLKSSAASTQAFVTIGGNSIAFALGAVFGARKWRQFKPWRGNQWAEGDFPAAGVGYFFVSDVREHRDEIEQMYLDGIAEISRLAFPD